MASRRCLGVILALLLPVLAGAGQSTPTYTWTGAAPAGVCFGPRTYVNETSGAIYCCDSGTWSACGTRPSGASGTLQTSNGSGALSSYSGTGAAPASKWISSLSSTGAATWTQPAWADIASKPSVSGIGACGANTWASTLNSYAAPTCTQPGFGNLAGKLALSQLTDDDVATSATRVLINGGPSGDPWWGQVDAALIAPGAIDWSKFGTGVRPMAMLASNPTLPSSAYPEGTVIYNTTSKTLLRVRSGGAAWDPAIAGSDIVANSITAGQLHAGAIDVNALGAGTILASILSAGVINSSHIQTNSIHADRLDVGTLGNGLVVQDGLLKFSGTIEGELVTAGQITAPKINSGNGTTEPMHYYGAFHSFEMPTNAFTPIQVLRAGSLVAYVDSLGRWRANGIEGTSDWQNATLEAGFTADATVYQTYSPPPTRYRKVAGVVYVEISVSRSVGDGSPIFFLPVGYRPSGYLSFNGGGGNQSFINVRPDGGVISAYATANPIRSAFSFPADQ